MKLYLHLSISLYGVGSTNHRDQFQFLFTIRNKSWSLAGKENKAVQHKRKCYVIIYIFYFYDVLTIITRTSILWFYEV
jgi:hypothetical protein